MELSEFESKINRSGPFNYRSKRLDSLVSAIKVYLRAKSAVTLGVAEDALMQWQREDPKEYRNRLGPIEAEFYTALSTAATLERGSGKIPMADRSSHPTYEPDKWNTPRVQQSTNCYAYACDDPNNHVAGTKPQPGRYFTNTTGGRHQGAMQFYGELSTETVRLAVLQDDQSRQLRQKAHLLPCLGTARGGMGPVVNVPGYYLIALVIRERGPRPDYHWYRQDNTGLWSHKPGHTQATNLDASGRIITDPRDCDLGTYEFEMFYLAPRGGVRTASLGDSANH